MASKWKISGYIFSIASAVMLVALINSFHVYYVKEYAHPISNSTSTLAEGCDNDDATTMLFCHPIQQEKYHFLGGLLLSLGLAISCFARDSEIIAKAIQKIPDSEP